MMVKMLSGSSSSTGTTTQQQQSRRRNRPTTAASSFLLPLLVVVVLTINTSFLEFRVVVARRGSGGRAVATATTNAVPTPLLATASPAPAVETTATTTTTTKSPFQIIIDGGSTGSRLHVFEFVDDECLRRGSTRADVPMSSFGRLPSEINSNQKLDPVYVAEHMIPLFEYAATVIPSNYHDATPVFYQATAGMRLLDIEEQDAVYDALFNGLQQDSRFVFKNGLERRNIATLSGELEAYFGAVAANFLQGVIDTELRLVSGSDDEDEESNKQETKPQPSQVVGALDMGGSSTQIVYMADPSKIHRVTGGGDETTCANNDDGQEPSQNCQQEEPQQPSESPKISDDHFFSTSYLSYGVDQFRERMWTHLVTERIQEEEEQEEYPESCASKYIQNPCANNGYTVEWLGFTLVGTGNTKECIRETQRLIPHPEIPQNHGHYDDDDHEDKYNTSTREKKKVVGGIEHPPVRGKFLAMSLYFFTLDSLREFSSHEPLHLSWPTPSIQELHDALPGLCSREWHSDMALQEGVHEYSRPAVLPHRCIESVYLVTLLKDGFGFEPSSRDITFTYKVDGDEVEWTLGMALAMNAEETIDEQKELDDELHRKPQHNESINEQLMVQAASHPYLYFGVTSAPTYCC